MPPINLVTVRYGPDAAHALRDAVSAAKADEPLAPVTVVVPSNHVGVTARRLLGSGRLGPVCGRGVGLAGVTFLTTYRLAELLGSAALAGQGRRPVSTPVLAAAVRGVLGAEPGLFAEVADHPATETALVATYRELRDVPPAALGAVAATGTRAADVVRIHRATRAVLAPDWYDEEDLTAAAAARLRSEPRTGAELGAVVVHLPQVVSLHAAELLRAVGEIVPVTVVAGLAATGAADDEVLTSLARLGIDTPAPSPAPPPVAADRTRILSTSDADDEVRAAVRAVVDAARAGTPLDRIAILHAAPDPYARLLHEHLAAAGIGRNGASPVAVSARVAGRALTGLLDLPEQGWSRHAVLAWLNGAPVLHDGRRPPLAAWETLSRDAGVVRGREHWDQRLAALADGLDAEAVAVVADDGPQWRVERSRRAATRARDLRTFVLELVGDLDRAASRPRTWAEHSRWLRRVLHRAVGSAAHRTRWPDDGAERRAAERVELAIDRLGALGAVEAGTVPLDVVARTLAVELESDLGRVGRFGDGVLVSTLAMGAGLDLDLVVVVGLAEGLVPSAPRDDSLLPDRERRAAGGLLPLRRDLVGRQHRELVAALASGRSQVLSYPRGDLRRSNERVPSRWLLDVASTLAGERWWAPELAAARAPWLTHVQSFDHGLRHLSVPATPQEHRLRTLLATGTGSRSFAPVRALGDPVLIAGAELVEGRSSPRLTRFDGNLAGLALSSPADPETARTASATGLERWARCPFDYFLSSVLGVRELENPEDALTISPLDRGSLIHDVLERFVLEVLARPEPQRPGPHDRWTAADRARLRDLGLTACAGYEAQGRTGRTLFWNRDRARILADLDATLTFDEEVRDVEGSRHLAAELAFGADRDAVDPVALPLPDGRHVQFKGKADRVDRTGAGGLLVADYKTGSDRDFVSLSEENPDQGGTRLQLAVYGAAARAAVGEPDARVRAEYWFTSRKAGFTRRGYELTAAVTERISETLGLIVEGIERGTFPAHPTEQTGAPFNPCWSCDPDFLGVADLRRTWAEMADDPALAGYLTLIDPERRINPDVTAGPERRVTDEGQSGVDTGADAEVVAGG
ncbi:PD-(D/E)XK nuclease family protein [Iamia sp.]|uniref:PD-(D/E)XK nuclease family protein n=1 Tax=Iamia sp. TaxID=2722710 RepID=UPI002BB4B434|nr:PD-(D/E)XK nuclease family protein [Iamia sp.]HXH58386.1 PD-(D/E)XK nuclease family protein [Iamia sp.]